MSEADIKRQIYLKNETVLSDVGHFHDSVEFIFMLQGSIEAHRVSERTVISAGEIFFADSFVCHYYRKLTPDIKAIVLVLSREYTSVFGELYRGKTCPAYMKDREKNGEIIELVQKWVQEEEKTYMCNIGYCNLMLDKIVKNYGLLALDESKNKSVVIKLLKYIGEHFDEDISLKSIAAEIGYTKEYCSKIFCEVTGLKFREYLNYIRLKEADKYFGTPGNDLTALEVMYKCGFNSSATFYRAKKILAAKNITFSNT